MKRLRKKIFLLLVSVWLVIYATNRLSFFSTDLPSSASTNSTTNIELEEVEFVRVVDGDTIVVKLDGKDTKIRLLCINTPESVHLDKSKNNVYGKKASKYTKKLLEDTEYVYLEFDEEREDIYGRTLAYVWLSDDDIDTAANKDIKKYMLNAILVKAGYAVTVVYEPNKLHADYFYKLQNTAKKNKVGLWKYKGFISLVE